MSAIERNHAQSEAGASLQPPRDDLFRALIPGGDELTASVRAAADDAPSPRPVMFGHFAKFNEWAEIDSVYEGHFLERVAPNAFKKTFEENGARMRVLFHHGRDATMGVQVLGKVLELTEDEEGAYYEVDLFESVPALVMDGLRAGQYGSSYRFQILRDDFVQRPRRSEHNPKGLPERTIQEVRVREFGPTPFGAYAGATSNVRSLTDEVLLQRFSEDPERLAEMLARAKPDTRVVARISDERSERIYSRSVETVASTPWALEPSALATIVGIIAERASGHKPTPDEIRERIGTRAAADALPETGDVAVISVHGPIVPHAGMFDDVSGLASIDGLQASFRAALADTNVSGILFDFDTPGGSVDLIPEMAAEIMAARGTKPIVAQVNTMAASAGYWLACACDEIVVTPSGDVGSIGVYNAHTDVSGAQAKAGIKTTLVHAGDYKVERNPFAPLSDAAKAEMQARVDSYYEMFVQAVADGRAVDPETVLADFGQGRLVMSTAAVDAGMADSVATFDETLQRLRAKTAGTATASEPAAPATPGQTEPEPPEATTHDQRVPLWGATGDEKERWRL